jgi:hypothetical protein
LKVKLKSYYEVEKCIRCWELRIQEVYLVDAVPKGRERTNMARESSSLSSTARLEIYRQFLPETPAEECVGVTIKVHRSRSFPVVGCPIEVSKQSHSSPVRSEEFFGRDLIVVVRLTVRGWRLAEVEHTLFERSSVHVASDPSRRDRRSHDYHGPQQRAAADRRLR